MSILKNVSYYSNTIIIKKLPFHAIFWLTFLKDKNAYVFSINKTHMRIIFYLIFLCRFRQSENRKESAQ